MWHKKHILETGGDGYVVAEEKQLRRKVEPSASAGPQNSHHESQSSWILELRSKYEKNHKASRPLGQGIQG